MSNDTSSRAGLLECINAIVNSGAWPILVRCQYCFRLSTHYCIVTASAGCDLHREKLGRTYDHPAAAAIRALQTELDALAVVEDTKRRLRAHERGDDK